MVTEISYRKSAEQLADNADEEQLLSKSTVWKKKQEKGQQLDEAQQRWFDNPDEFPMLAQQTDSNCKVARNSIQVQIDEVITKSQEKDKKVNVTYTATLETEEGKCFYLAAKSSLHLFWLVWIYLIRLGITSVPTFVL